MSVFPTSYGALTAALICIATSAFMPVQSQSLDKLVSAKSQTSADGTRQKSAVKKKVSKRSAKPTFDRGSAETTAERTARLKRECKGGVNAGACAGYTR